MHKDSALNCTGAGRYLLVAGRLGITGGLEKIDREACIEGILRMHYGKGHFTSPVSEGGDNYGIDGNARNTIAAYESLRVLGALDRVKDLDQWQFRLKNGRLLKDRLTWSDVEAWVCQQRFKEILQEHKEHPQKPYGSLLEWNR